MKKLSDFFLRGGSSKCGGFALGLVAGVCSATLIIVWTLGPNYCPNAPCDASSARAWHIPNALRPAFSYEADPEFRGDKPTRYEYYDLVAQERVALATDWLVWSTIVSIALSIVGFLFIMKTIRLQISANSIAKSTGIAQTRAWLNADVRLSSPRKAADGRGFYFTIIVDCRNYGQSPALNVNFWANITVKPGGVNDLDQRVADLKASIVESAQLKEAVFPNAERKLRYDVLLAQGDIDNAISKSQDGGMMPVLSGCISYTVVGSERVHWTCFSYCICSVIGQSPSAIFLDGSEWPKWKTEIVSPGFVTAD